MKEKTKKILLFSLGLAGAGIILMGAGMLSGGIPGVRISQSGITSPYREAQYIQERTMMGNYISIHDIDIDIDSDAEVIFRPSDDICYHVEYVLNGAYEKPLCEATDNVLKIRQKSTSSLVAMDLSFLFGKLPEEKLIIYIPEKERLDTISVCHHNTFRMTDLWPLHLKEIHLKDDHMELTATCAEGGNYSNEPLVLIMEPGKLTVDCLYADTLLLSAEHSTCELTNLRFNTEAAFTLDSCDITLTDISSTEKFCLSNSYGTTHISRFDFDDAIFTLDNASMDLNGGRVFDLDCQISYGNLNLTLPDATSQYNFDMQTQYGTITFPGMENQISSVDSDTQSCQIDSKTKSVLDIKVRGESADITVNEGGASGPRQPGDYYHYFYNDTTDYSSTSGYIGTHHPEPDGQHPDEHH